jgi:hypothetical protein
MVDLSDENGCGRFADGAEHRQSPHLVGMRKGALCIGQRRFAIRFDVRDLPRDQVVARKHALNVAPKKWGERSTIAGPHRVKSPAQAFADVLADEPNAVQRQKPFDPSHNADPFLDEILPLTLDAFGILLLDARDLHVASDFAVARQPTSQDPSHAFGVEAVRLCNPSAPRHQETRRIEHDRTDAAAISSRASQKPS